MLPAPRPSVSKENAAVPEVTLGPAVKLSVPPPIPAPARTDNGWLIPAPGVARSETRLRTVLPELSPSLMTESPPSVWTAKVTFTLAGTLTRVAALKAVGLAEMSAPPFRLTVPLKVLAPERVKVPKPDMVKPTGPAKVALTAAAPGILAV